MTTTFEKLLLADYLKEAMSLGAVVKNAWVHKCGRQWEFHYGDFYWNGRAENAYDARANGWASWIIKTTEG